MRFLVVVLLAAVAPIAAAQPAPPPQPYPIIAPTPLGPAPQPAPPPAERTSPLVFAAGLGIAGVTLDPASGPCPMCEHSGIAASVHGGLGVTVLPNLALGGELKLYFSSVAGHMGASAKHVQLGFFATGQYRVFPHLQIIGGLGYSGASYSWEESNFLGSSTESEDIGSGPALLGAARLQFYGSRQLDIGLEGRIEVAYLDTVGTLPAVSVEVVAGWF